MMIKHDKIAKSTTTGLLLCLIATLLPSLATAADWYLRGTVGYERSRTAHFGDVHCASTDPPALFGCPTGEDGKPIGAYGDFGRFPALEAAIGRQILRWLRADFSVSYRFNMDYTGNANFLSVGVVQPVDSEAYSLSGMINLFVDLNPLLHNPGGLVHPYIGGGIGMARNRIDAVTFRFPENPGNHKLSVTPSGRTTDVAFMLTVGTEVMLSQQLSLDMAYRYFDLGDVKTAQGRMSMDVLPAGIEIDRIKAPLRTHGPTIGLRYRF